MKSYYKKQDNICIRLGHQTKSDLIALAQANEMNVAEYIRMVIKEVIVQNQEVIQSQQALGIHKDDSADIE